jgi:hypothetical protein
MRRRIAATIVIATLALAGVALAVTLPAPDRSPRSPSVTLTSHQLRMRNSKAGLPVVGATNMKPGDRVRGGVRVHTGGADSEVTLSATDLADQPGPNGGRLIRRLRVIVRERVNGAFETRYSGPLSGLDGFDLGTWPAGTTRKYAIAVRFPRSSQPPPGGDNRYQGSVGSFGLLWTATGV